MQDEVIIDIENPKDNDLISRQAAIDIFDKWLSYGNYNYSERNIMNCAIAEIKELPSYSEIPNKWIPVSERLPEDSDEYLVSVIDEDDKSYKQVGVAWFAHPKDYNIKEGEWRELMFNEKVIAWMPLPSPFQLQEGE